jgi:hypothetical protein
VALVRTALLAVALSLSVSAVLAQEFSAFEGKNALREGEGGSKKVVEGIDFWSDGAPPRKFKLLGFVTDRRHKTGLVGMISMSSLEKDVAELAKKNGGDAVILMASDAETVGVVGNSFGSASGTATVQGNTVNARSSGWNTGMAAPVQKQNSKFAVVQYVKEEAPASPVAPATAPAAAPAAPTEAAAETKAASAN